MRRLTKDEHFGPEFATTWPQYDLDEKTRALLAYAKKLTQEPGMVEDSDVEDLRAAGWDERGSTKLRRSSRSTTSADGWKRLRGYRWISCQEKHLSPKRLPVSQPCQLVPESKHTTRRKEQTLS